MRIAYRGGPRRRRRGERGVTLEGLGAKKPDHEFGRRAPAQPRLSVGAAEGQRAAGQAVREIPAEQFQQRQPAGVVAVADHRRRACGACQIGRVVEHRADAFAGGGRQGLLAKGAETIELQIKVQYETVISAGLLRVDAVREYLTLELPQQQLARPDLLPGSARQLG